jgi:hypothetical protein
MVFVLTIVGLGMFSFLPHFATPILVIAAVLAWYHLVSPWD